MTKAVKFRKRYSLYNAGEIAGFPAAEAERLVRSGVAAWLMPAAPPAASAPPPDTEPVEPGPGDVPPEQPTGESPDTEPVEPASSPGPSESRRRGRR